VVDYLGGACLLIRRKLLRQVGDFDENFFIYCEDLDLGYRVKKAGWKIYYYVLSKIIHYGNQSAKQRWSNPEKIVINNCNLNLFYKKHYGLYYLLVIRLVTSIFIILRLFVHALRFCICGCSSENIKLKIKNDKLSLKYTFVLGNDILNGDYSLL